MAETTVSIGAKALLGREYHGGTRVTNCVRHMGLEWDARPRDCDLCQTDIRNMLSIVIGMNRWLNAWKDDATKLLREIAK